MNILLICPEFPDTFWSFKHALSFIGKRANVPPLGLLTVAAMLPKPWNKRMVDCNVTRLKDADLAWADYVFVTAMAIQRQSVTRLIARCHAAGKKVVAGGPLFTGEPADFDQVDHLVLNEAEVTLPPFLADLQAGVAKHIYQSDQYADLHTTPPPLWELADMRRYVSMSIQYSRGCPFNCDFCNITSMFGRKPRTKTTQQIIAELDALRHAGWTDSIFFVDDNLIGNPVPVKRDLLPAIIQWRHRGNHNALNTQVSINLADDPIMLEMMVQAGFQTVFVGIETPEDGSLAECNKRQNTHRDLVADVKRLQKAGLEVQGGFIVGFDSDPPSIFQRQIDFIQKSGIVAAMVGVLQAPPGTQLYHRLLKQGRILGLSSGDNVDGTTNIIPAMGLDALLEGYKKILAQIYSPKRYYQRLKTFLREYKPRNGSGTVNMSGVMAFVRSAGRLGILGKERLQYWKLLIWTLCRRPASLPMAIELAIAGYHFRKTCELNIA